MTAGLRELIARHGLETGRTGTALVFGATADRPFVASTVDYRARVAWGWKRVKNPDPTGHREIWVQARPDALAPIALHEARHSCASFLIEAGLTDVELTATIGHSDPRTTKSVYGHLLGDSGAKTAAKLDAYHAPASADR